MQIYAPSNAVNRIRSSSFIKPIIFADVQIRKKKNILNLKRVERTKITYIDFCLLFEQYQILLNIDQPRNDYRNINTAIKLHASSRIGDVNIFNNYKYTTLLLYARYQRTDLHRYEPHPFTYVLYSILPFVSASIGSKAAFSDTWTIAYHDRKAIDDVGRGESRRSHLDTRNSSRGYHMGTARARMSLDKSGRHREICHAGENRREISRVNRDDRTWYRRDEDEDSGVDGKGWRGWWASTSPRKHEGAAALYDASGLRPVFNLSETFWHKPFSLPASSDDTRSPNIPRPNLSARSVLHAPRRLP